MAGDDHNEGSLTVAGAGAALAAIRDGGTWRGPWPDPSLGIDTAGVQLVASCLRAGHSVPDAIAAAPDLRRLWTALGLDPAALPDPEGSSAAPGPEGGA